MIQIFDNFRKKLGQNAILASTAPDQKITGIGHISTDQLLDLAAHHIAFPQNRHSILQTANWNRLFSKDIIHTPIMFHFKEVLAKSLKDKPIIELGVGDNFDLHQDFFKSKFKVSQYTAIDRRKTNSEEVIESDLLKFLESYQGTANIVAFGVFNEPMSPDVGFFKPSYLEKLHHGHIEHEYLRRVAKQIARITGDSCVFFGEGLHPFFRSHLSVHRYISQVFDNYLWAYGMQPPRDLMPLLDSMKNNHIADFFLLQNS